MAELCRGWDDGAGAAVVAEEALAPAACRAWPRPCGGQPAWSDLPLLVLTGGGKATRATTAVAQALEPRGNVTLLERPLRMLTLVSAVQAALRCPPPPVRGAATCSTRPGGRSSSATSSWPCSAHELRNPLGPIRNAIQILQAAGGDRPRRPSRPRHDRAGRCGTWPGWWTTCWTSARITRGKIELRTEPVDLAARRARRRRRRAGRWSRPAARLTVTLPAGPVWVDGDPARLEQVSTTC